VLVAGEFSGGTAYAASFCARVSTHTNKPAHAAVRRVRREVERLIDACIAVVVRVVANLRSGDLNVAGLAVPASAPNVQHAISIVVWVPLVAAVASPTPEGKLARKVDAGFVRLAGRYCFAFAAA
jgi:hypothetical protein